VTRIRSLPAARHAVYRLAPGLLLVFKPRGHRESEHAHPHRQRLRVLCGKLEVRIGQRRVTLEASSRPLAVPAARAHETRAVQNTWLIAESFHTEARRHGEVP
jgi:quercetin dioxygenase-like cupin family protein